MADLTPPASQSNTPLRPSTAEPISSPSKPPSNSSNFTANQPIGRPITPEEPGEPTGEKIEVDEEGESSDDEESAELDDENQMEGVESPDNGSGQAESTKGTSGTAGVAGESKKRTRGPAAKGSKRAVKGKGKAIGETKKPPGPTPKKQVGKEGDLYESDIVARWKSEFGDVCAERPIKA